MSPRIAVLVSTYNGERFLAAQLDSLAAQRDVEVQLFARDDGSDDGTLAILARYADRWPALARPLNGSNLGPAASFLALLTAAPEGFDAYAFCDQDDQWLPDKLARAADALAGDSGPALYCSQVMCVDADLRPLGPAPVKRDGRFEHLLYENIAFGVTVAMNGAAAALVRRRPPGPAIIMHDWWCALVVSAFGKVIYDERPSVNYRQHGANQIGQATGRLGETARLLRMMARAPRRFWPVSAQAAELLRLYGAELPEDRRAAAEALAGARRSIAARLRLAFSDRVVREGRLSGLAARFLILAGLC